MSRSDHGVATNRHGQRALPPIQLTDELSFLAHPWIDMLIPRFEHDAMLARHAMHRLIEDLRNINELYAIRERRAFFTSIDGRVKTQVSFFRKLYAICKARSAKKQA